MGGINFIFEMEILIVTRVSLLQSHVELMTEKELEAQLAGSPTYPSSLAAPFCVQQSHDT